MVRHKTLRRYTSLALLLSVTSACTGDERDGKTALQATAAPAATPTSGPDQKYGLTAEQAAQALVTIGDRAITLGQFAERLGGQSPYLRARYNSPDRRREFLDNMVRFELLSIEAEKRGYDRAGEVERVRKQMMVQQMMQDLFEKQGIKLSDVSDAEIKRYYEENASEFDKPAQVRASHILFKDKATAQKVLAELRSKPQDMQLFRRLAEQYNQDPQTKDSFGDLRFFSATVDESGERDEPERPASVRKAAFALENVGDLAGEVVESERGFHIVKLTGKRDALVRSLEDARRLIQNRLWRKKREEAIEKFVAELRAKANVQESPELLGKVQVKTGQANAHAHDHGHAHGPDHAHDHAHPAEEFDHGYRPEED